jgi:hypothetical protein
MQREEKSMTEESPKTEAERRKGKWVASMRVVRQLQEPAGSESLWGQ